MYILYIEKKSWKALYCGREHCCVLYLFVIPTILYRVLEESMITVVFMLRQPFYG